MTRRVSAELLLLLLLLLEFEAGVVVEAAVGRESGGEGGREGSQERTGGMGMTSEGSGVRNQ